MLQLPSVCGMDAQLSATYHRLSLMLNSPKINHCFCRLSSMSSIFSMLDDADIDACNWFCKLLCICVCRFVCIGVGRLVSMDACKVGCRAGCVFVCIAFCRQVCIWAWRVFCKLLCIVDVVEGAAWAMGCMWAEFWGWLWAGRLAPGELSIWEVSGRKGKGENKEKKM